MTLQKIEFGKISNRNVTVVYDSALDSNFLNIEKLPKSELFNLFYAGEITKYRHLNLDKLVEALKEIDDVKVTFAGKGEIDEIKGWVKSFPDKVEFIGSITYREVLKRSLNADLLFVLRDSDIPLNRYVCGSKVFEAMMCGKPIIVSTGTSTATIVSKEKFGLVVDPANVQEIRSAITTLKENQLLLRILGKNARKAYDETYGWHIMGERLLTLYNQLLVDC